MGTELKKSVAEYRLIYFEPDPEDAESICVGVFITDGRTTIVDYDAKFSKLQCVAPGFEASLMRFYLDDLAEQLRQRPAELDIVLRSYGSQLATSGPRRLFVPITQSLRAQLLERFVLPRPRTSSEKHQQEREMQTARNLEAFIKVFSPNATVLHDVKPVKIFGENYPTIRATVALAITARESLVLVDGVDLKVSTATQVVSSANRIVHTFWQYGRVRETKRSLFGEIKRVGIVLNGVQRIEKALGEAHDYALDQFKKESELSVDAASETGSVSLRKMLS